VINVSASIHQRLLNKSIAEKKVFNEILQYYAIERFLYRLSKSSYREKFILKGSFVFLAWQVPLTRPTKDMDFLGFTDNSVQNLIQIVNEICQTTVEGDGLYFDIDSIRGQIIKEEAEYQGVRILFLSYLGNAKIHMRLDVGFSDIVTPEPGYETIPPILSGMTAASMKIYPPETVIAEKFQTLVFLGKVNSRMKDYYDLWFMFTSMPFSFTGILAAMQNTFVHRKTEFPTDLPYGLTKELAEEKQFLWKIFLKRNQLNTVPENLSEIIAVLEKFFKPLIFQKDCSLEWNPEFGWVK